MLRNYITIAWRQLIRNKAFSFINVFGLGVSLAICFCIVQYAVFELRYDRFIDNAENIYRITTQVYEQRKSEYETALTAYKLNATLQEKLPEVLRSAQLLSTRSWFHCAMKYTDGETTKIFNESNLYYADAPALSLFSFHLIQGDERTALEKPHSAVLTQSAARRYFGSAEAMGKVIHLQGSFTKHDYVVTGVMQDLPADSHLDVEILLSISSIDCLPYVENQGQYTYVELVPSADMALLKAKLRHFVSDYLPVLNSEGAELQLDIQPITDIHLHSSRQDEIKPGGNAASVYFLVLVAFAILLMAWINYVNLSTARSIYRVKEAGIRKVSGAASAQLIAQFVVEALIIHALSVAFAFLLIYFLSPLLSEIIRLPMPYTPLGEPEVVLIGVLVLTVFFAGMLLSGFYPGKIMASRNPAAVLKGKVTALKNGLVLKKVLVVFQFACAVALAVAVLTFNRQFRFMERKALGIDIARTVVVKIPAGFDSSYVVRLAGFKSGVASHTLIQSIATSGVVPGDKMEWTGNVRLKNEEPAARQNFVIQIADPDFISTYGLHLLAGRNFEMEDFPLKRFGDKIESVMLNETGVKQLGFARPEEAVKTTVFWNNTECVVVGVVNDFHQQSLKDPLNAVLFIANNGPMLSLKFNTGINNESIAYVENEWKSFFPDYPFDYFVLEDFYAAQYAEDKRISTLFHFFCGVAILIAVLGLIGLSSITVRQRTKEMGVRRVLGASITQLVSLLTREFLILVIVASFMAMPLSYIGIDYWLQSFAFHVSPDGWLFGIPVLVVLAIAGLATGLLALKTAWMNPVETLRHE